jgi:hypothetical protein
MEGPGGSAYEEAAPGPCHCHIHESSDGVLSGACPFHHALLAQVGYDDNRVCFSALDAVDGADLDEGLDLGGVQERASPVFHECERVGCLAGGLVVLKVRFPPL